MKFFVFTCYRRATNTMVHEAVRVKFKSDLMTFFELFKQEMPQFSNHEYFEVTPDVFEMLDKEISV